MPLKLPDEWPSITDDICTRAECIATWVGHRKNELEAMNRRFQATADHSAEIKHLLEIHSSLSWAMFRMAALDGMMGKANGQSP